MKTSHLPLLAVAALLTAAPLTAQGLWNRRVTGVALTAQPGGGYDVQAAVQVQLFDPVSAPLDMSLEAELSLNGIPIASTTLGQVVEPTAGGCGAAAPCSGGCGFGTWGLLGCAVHIPTGTQCVCSGSQLAPLFSGVSLQPGDELMILLRPSPGAFPEADTSDDTLVLTFDGSEVYWNRRIGAIDVVPTAGAPDVFFDIWVELDSETPGMSFADLAGEAELWSATSLLAVEPVDGIDDILFPTVPVDPGEVLTVVLKPAPGALPELPGFPDDEEEVEVPTLFTDLEELSLHSGGVQNFDLLAGPVFADEFYLLMGSATGTQPGIPFGGVVLPLLPDDYFLFSVTNANQLPFGDTLGFLDGDGEAAATFTVPPGSNPNLAGLTLYHAYLVLDSFPNGAAVHASNPRTLELTL